MQKTDAGWSKQPATPKIREEEEEEEHNDLTDDISKISSSSSEDSDDEDIDLAIGDAEVCIMLFPIGSTSSLIYTALPSKTIPLTAAGEIRRHRTKSKKRKARSP